MIPPHLAARAAKAHAEYRTKQALEVGFYTPVSSKQTPLPEVAIGAMDCALSAVAAEIWEQGYQAGAHDEWEYQRGIPDTGLWHNPYPGA